MKIRYVLGISLLALAGLVLATLAWHNRATEVNIVLLGQGDRAMSLGGAIARASGAGAMLGIPLAGSWWVSDWWQQRRSRRRMLHWVERLESKTYSPLPPAIAEPYRADPNDYSRDSGEYSSNSDYAANAADWSSDTTTWQERGSEESDWNNA